MTTPQHDKQAARFPVPTGEAHTLTADEYLSPEVYERERAAIFNRTWQIVARTADLTRPGDFVPANILDEPIVLVQVSTAPSLGSTTSAATAPVR